GNSHAIAIAANAGDDTREQMPRLGMIRAAEAERIEVHHRACAHGEDIAQDASHACRRTLIGLDEARVIVAFDLENCRQTFTKIDDPSIFTGALDDLGPLCRQGLEPFLRGLVGAMLRPHDGKDAKLDQVRFAPEYLKDLVILGFRQSVLGDQLRGYLAHIPSPWNAHAKALTMLSKSPRPSVLPWRGSMASSG